MDVKRVTGAINRRADLSLQRMYMYKLSKPDAWVRHEPNDITPRWELLSPEQLGWLQELGPFNVSAGLQRLERGDLCYTVRIAGRLAHYSWVQRTGSHPITKAGRFTTIRNGEFWIYNCSTVDWARGRRIYPATLERIVSDHFEAGYSTACIYTPHQNVASQRGISRAGFSMAGTFSALRLGSYYLSLGAQ